MATHVTEKTSQPKNLANSMEFELALEFVRVVEEAAIASAHTNGHGRWPQSRSGRHRAMRNTMEKVPMRGTIVIARANATKLPCFTSASKWRGLA